MKKIPQEIANKIGESFNLIFGEVLNEFSEKFKEMADEIEKNVIEKETRK